MKAISKSVKLVLFLIVMLAFSYNITAQTNTLPSSGNVGIGTTTPSAALDVYGNTKLNGRVTIDSIMVVRDSATFQNKLTVNQDLKVKQDLTIKGKSVFVDNGTFKTDLKVLGDVRIKSLADSTSTSFRIATLNNNGKLTSLDRSGLVGSIYDPQIQCPIDLNGLFIPVWSAKGLTPTLGALFTGVNCPAWVGIGTDNPTANLDVRGKGLFTSDLQVLQNASKMVIGAASSQDLGHGTSYLGFNAQRIGSATGIWQTSSDGPHNGGAVIYGDIFGSLRFVTLPYTNTPNQGQNLIPDATVAQNTRLFIHRDGNVGIGTDNPLELFQIGEEFTFHSGGTKAISRNYYFDNATQSSKRIKNGFVSTLRFNDLGSIDLLVGPSDAAGSTIDFTTMKGLHIGQNGNVGIGTTATTGAKLSVEGFIRAREVIVNLSTWSDFVFESTYKLKTLHEVEQHIQTYKHLPNVPSEKEVLENGVSLGEMNAVLLQKVEELTLYIIELNKRMEQLEADNKVLKEK